MDKVADNLGNPIKGLFRSLGQGLVVDDLQAFNKYETEKQRALEVDKLRIDVEQLKDNQNEILTILKEIRWRT